MKPQSARLLTTACPKPEVPLEDCQREYGRVTRSASPQRSRYTGPSSFPPSRTVQRPGFSIGSSSGYLGGFTNAACAPYHPHPKPSSAQSAVGGTHQESVSTATYEHAGIDHQPSQQFSSARNEPSSSHQDISTTTHHE